MPRAEPDEEHVVSSNEPREPGRDLLESGQRYGLMEDERSISGQKRICYCLGYTQGWCERRFLPYFLLVMYPIVFLIGYYSGYISNCICENGSSPM